ncbi:MAG: hypothetical protein O2983_01645 [Planctomycetota bacterium]|nr:hypothetical protein [Planctomycetota bacterium]
MRRTAEVTSSPASWEFAFPGSDPRVEGQLTTIRLQANTLQNA